MTAITLSCDGGHGSFERRLQRFVESGTVPFGDPQSVLLDEAKAWGADLIVLGSHGRHGIDRVLMGSVSESVALHAHCSVEVMRPHKEESSLKQTPAKYVSRMSA